MALEPGTRLGQYEVISPLGAGGMGEVYRARDTRLGRDVALKLLPVLHGKSASLERFTREARLASALNHPNIVTVHEIGTCDAGSFIVMELVVGRTLRSALDEDPSPARVLRLASQVAKALAVAHGAGIVHRDLKPDNIMVRADGYVKVVDFGLATAIDEDGPDTPTALTGVGDILGTIPYMSPEQVRGDTLSGASDIFSFGVLLYELLAHRHPFRSTSTAATLTAILSLVPPPPSQLDSVVSPELDRLVGRMLEKNAGPRPTAAELVEELEALSGDTRPPAARPPTERSPRPPVAGRARERATLLEAFEAAASGHGAMICLAGEAGAGKSTLAEDFLLRVAEQDTDGLIARGRCSERLAGNDAGLPFLEALAGLQQTGGIAGRLLPALAPTWCAQIARDESALEPAPDRLKWEMGRFLDELSKHRPIVLLLDDLHWAGVATVDLIAYLGSRLASLRILVVATYRPSELLRGRHPFLPVRLDLEARGLCRELRAEPLDRDAVEEYLRLEFPGHALPPTFAASIQARTEGNPLFMVDLLRYLRDRGAIASVDGTYTLNELTTNLERELPASVRSMVERTLGQVSEADRKLLEVASVQGQEFDSAVIARALALPAEEVEDRLDALDRVHAVARQVDVRELPDHTLSLRYRFAHALYQNAVYDGLRPTRKAASSAAVASALLAFHGDRSAAIASELALLFESARDFPRAIDYFEISARNAVRLFANREAVSFLRSALRLLLTQPPDRNRDSRELALQAAIGAPLVSTCGYAAPEPEKAYSRAWELSRSLGQTAQHFGTLLGVWNFHEVSGRLRSAGELADELLGLATEIGDPIPLLMAHRAVANVALWTGAPLNAKAHFERALSLYQPGLHLDAVKAGLAPSISCRGMLGWAEWLLGDPDQARHQIEQQCAIAQELAHPFTTAISLIDASIFYQLCGDVPAVANASADLIRLAGEEGFALWLAGGRVMHGWATFHLGHRDEGLAETRLGLEQWQATGAELAMPYYLSLLAANQGIAGDTAGGLASVDEALRRADGTGEHWWKPGLLLVQGDLLSVDDPTAGRLAWQAAFDLAQASGALALERRAAERLGTHGLTDNQ